MTPLNSSCLFNISNWISNKLLECAISRIQFLITPTHLLLPQSSSYQQLQLLPSRCLNRNPRTLASSSCPTFHPSANPIGATFSTHLEPDHFSLITMPQPPSPGLSRQSSNWPLCFLSCPKIYSQHNSHTHQNMSPLSKSLQWFASSLGIRPKPLQQQASLSWSAPHTSRISCPPISSSLMLLPPQWPTQSMNLASTLRLLPWGTLFLP